MDEIEEIEIPKDLSNESIESDWENNRIREYGYLNQFEMMYDDKINNTNTWEEAILTIKSKYPKPENN